MTRASITAGAFVTALVLLAVGLVIPYSISHQNVEPATATAPASSPSAPAAPADAGFLYGRVTVADGMTYEGRLRFGGDQEAFWDDYFNGAKDPNPWAEYVSREHSPLEIFGIEFGGRDNRFDRQFMVRFGDLARVDAHVGTVQVRLKSGTMAVLDRFNAGDIDDGLRVWDERRGVVDLDAREIRTIEFLPTARLVDAPDRLHGTVRTRHGEFTGFIQWDREDCVGSDTLDGRDGEREVSHQYDTIRAIARHSGRSARVTLRDGREMVLSDTSEVGGRIAGVSVDDRRYGRVRISWEAFEQVEFSPAGSGSAYNDFPPGRSLTGSVTTRDGRRLSGRLVYDVDESETTDTLEAGWQGVDYTIHFGRIASIVLDSPNGGRPLVILEDGEELALDRNGDLGDRNAGVLIFVEGRERPEHVPWADVARIDLDVRRATD